MKKVKILEIKLLSLRFNQLHWFIYCLDKIKALDNLLKPKVHTEKHKNTLLNKLKKNYKINKM